MSAAGAVHPPATRREKRRDRKKERRRQARRETAALARAAAAALAANPVEQRRLRELEEAEASASESARRAFEDAERRWLEAAAARAAAAAEQEEARKQSLLEASPLEKHKDDGDELGEGEEWEYVEEGPAEIIWQGNEITVKKKKVKVPKKIKDKLPLQEDDRPTSNPLPPQTSSFASHTKESSLSAQEVLEKVAQETPNFGTEQDKAHCPFHLKTGACRFGVRCSRVHFYPDRSCTLLIKNMYNGPGLAFEQDEGLEFTDEEVEHSYEEFYEDVHTEFLKFGELVNFKVCRNGSSHLRGNVYVHYKSLDSALLAYNSMNGRYFAGKQITCEFVAVTRWKAAICGEYMRTRLKTCSHGTACNFIHCFCNPGGDYEWADWDNAPPKYWIRKMTALFGPSDDAVFGKPSDVLDFERLRRSDRKLRSSDFERHDSRRSRNEVDAKKHHSLRDHYLEQYHGCHRTKSEHAQGRRELSAADRHQSHEVEDGAGKNSTSREYERGTDKHKHRERHRSDYGDDRTHRTQEYFGGKGDYRKSKSRKDRSDRQQSVESGLSDWPLDSTNRDVSKSPSSSKSSGRFSNCKKGYNGRQSSEDPDLERLYSTVHNSTEKEHAAKTRESLKHHAENYSSDDEKDGGRRRSRKHMTHTHKNHDDDSDDRWVATHSDADSDEEVQYRPSISGSTKLGRKDEKSSRKRKHHSESRKHKESKEDTPDS